jgi:hypothetical protein
MDHYIPNPKLKLREQLREVMRFKHMSIRTEETYWMWIKGFRKRVRADYWSVFAGRCDSLPLIFMSIEQPVL